MIDQQNEKSNRIKELKKPITVWEAADRIEELVKERDALKRLNDAQSQMLDAEEARAEVAEDKLAKAVEALKSLHHAVCGETGFASAVRNHSGKAYPWEALDIADAQTRTVLAKLEGEKK